VFIKRMIKVHGTRSLFAGYHNATRMLDRGGPA
jgi:hypothetical protein